MILDRCSTVQAFFFLYFFLLSFFVFVVFLSIFSQFNSFSLFAHFCSLDGQLAGLGKLRQAIPYSYTRKFKQSQGKGG